MTQEAYFANTLINKTLDDQQVYGHLISITQKDPNHIQHSIEVALISAMIGISLNLSKQQLMELTQAAILHDIGKIMIDEKVLNKPDQLTPTEKLIINEHARFGYNLIYTGHDKTNKRIAEAILHHHEDYDGNGYPDKLTNKKIPIYAKIIRVADTYQALITERVYKKALSPIDAMVYIIDYAGRLFDPYITYHLTKQIIHYPLDATIIYPNID